MKLHFTKNVAAYASVIKLEALQIRPVLNGPGFVSKTWKPWIWVSTAARPITASIPSAVRW